MQSVIISHTLVTIYITIYIAIISCTLQSTWSIFRRAKRSFQPLVSFPHPRCGSQEHSNPFYWSSWQSGARNWCISLIIEGGDESREHFMLTLLLEALEWAAGQEDNFSFQLSGDTRASPHQKRWSHTMPLPPKSYASARSYDRRGWVIILIHGKTVLFHFHGNFLPRQLTGLAHCVRPWPSPGEVGWAWHCGEHGWVLWQPCVLSLAPLWGENTLSKL